MNQPSPDTTDLAACLHRAVWQLSRQLRSSIHHEGLGAARASALAQLHRHGPMTPTALAARERVKLQSLTRLLAELEAEGWVQRRPDEADARRTVLALTPAGGRRLRAEREAREAALAQAVAQCLTPAERAALRAACGAIERVADALSEASVDAQGEAGR